MRTSGIGRFAVVSLVVGTLALAQASGEPVGYPETVPVGDLNNIPDVTGFGSVAYAYRIGTYEVTSEQYVEFLNATAKSSTQGWLPQMGMW